MQAGAHRITHLSHSLNFVERLEESWGFFMSHLLNLLIYLFSVPRCANSLLRSFRPCKGIGIPESVKIILVESVFREIFACGIRYFWLWNAESGIRWQRISNPITGLRNPPRWIQNPRQSWIPLHGAPPSSELRFASEFVKWAKRESTLQEG